MLRPLSWLRFLSLRGRKTDEVIMGDTMQALVWLGGLLLLAVGLSPSPGEPGTQGADARAEACISLRLEEARMRGRVRAQVFPKTLACAAVSY